jgi:hypothetical protein
MSADFDVATITAVIIREKRMIQYPKAGVLD